MKEATDKLSRQELEQLCRLYTDCRLSVGEEAELEYVLSRSDCDSPLLADTRRLMGLERELHLAPSLSGGILRHRRLQRGRLATAAALLAAVLLPLGFLFSPPPPSSSGDDYACVAYVGGRMLTGREAEAVLAGQMAETERIERMVSAAMAAENAQYELLLNSLKHPE